jgi:hypothetical protein
MAKTLVARRADSVLIIPGAVGGAGLVDGPWQPSSGYLFAAAAAKISEAAKALPDAIPVIAWIGGEADATAKIGARRYLIEFDAMIRGFDAAAGRPCLWVIGSMVPEYIAASPYAEAIDTVQRGLSVTHPRVRYAAGPSGSHKPGELFHYSADGLRTLGASMGAAVVMP